MNHLYNLGSFIENVFYRHHDNSAMETWFYNYKIHEVNTRYVNEIKPIEMKAIKTCRNWSKTECRDVNDMIVALKQYTILKNMELDGKEIPNMYKDDFKNIEEYRDGTNFFWEFVMQEPSVLHSVSDEASRNESLYNFSTLNWSVDFCQQKCRTRYNKKNTYTLCIYDEIMQHTYVEIVQKYRTEIISRHKNEIITYNWFDRNFWSFGKN